MKYHDVNTYNEEEVVEPEVHELWTAYLADDPATFATGSSESEAVEKLGERFDPETDEVRLRETRNNTRGTLDHSYDSKSYALVKTNENRLGEDGKWWPRPHPAAQMSKEDAHRKWAELPAFERDRVRIEVVYERRGY